MSFAGKSNFEKDIIAQLQKKSYDLDHGLAPLLDRIGDARLVLLGEASHGTHEYYTLRSQITQYLVKEKGFTIIGVEGDWPHSYQVNRYIRHMDREVLSAREVLEKFHRWPTWMWANWEIAALMEWLKDYNQGKAYNNQAGFYGLDVYSLWESLEAVMGYLQEHEPEALALAHKAVECFEPYNREGIEYASSLRLIPESCEQAVLKLLRQIRSNISWDAGEHEAPFDARQNALIAVNAEKYYRAMLQGGPEAWNIRDNHMAETLNNLLEFHGPQSKAVVWEHNTHIGDARASSMKEEGMVSVGQLVRQRWGEEKTVLVGFGSYQGTVMASKSWAGSMQKMQMPAARHDSWEAILHRFSPAGKILISDHIAQLPVISGPINHRAVGVVYHPERDHAGNYVKSVIPRRYDAFIFLDKTHALHPIYSDSRKNILPATYPWNV